MNKTTIKNLLNSEHSALQSLSTRINQMKRWNDYLSTCLPDEKKLFEHCQIVRFEQSILYIVTDNASWATRLRFFIPQLLQILRQYRDFQGIQAIKCKIFPLHYAPQSISRPANKLSKKSADILLEASQQIQDEKLKIAIEKMVCSSQKR